MANHKTGYYVWVNADKYWHKNINKAIDRKIKAQSYCSNVQIIEVSTGKLISGRSE